MLSMKIGSTIVGFVLICVGIAALAGETPVLGIHPAVWFILGAGLLISDSAWERLTHRKKNDDEHHPATNPQSGASKKHRHASIRAVVVAIIFVVGICVLWAINNF
ncbi:MAG: hypothetical protein ACLU06_07975 [Eggerthellaceae bacterium]